MGEPLQVVQLDLLIHVCGEDALLEVLRPHEYRPAVRVPSLYHLPDHLRRDVTRLDRLREHKRIGLQIRLNSVSHFCFLTYKFKIYNTTIYLFL